MISHLFMGMIKEFIKCSCNQLLTQFGKKKKKKKKNQIRQYAVSTTNVYLYRPDPGAFDLI